MWQDADGLYHDHMRVFQPELRGARTVFNRLAKDHTLSCGVRTLAWSASIITTRLGILLGEDQTDEHDQPAAEALKRAVRCGRTFGRLIRDNTNALTGARTETT